MENKVDMIWYELIYASLVLMYKIHSETIAINPADYITVLWELQQLQETTIHISTT